MDKMSEGSQKVQTHSFKILKHWRCNLSLLTNVYLKVANQVHLKSSYHKRKTFEATHGHGC